MLTRDLVKPLQLLNTNIDLNRKFSFKFDTVDLSVENIKTFKEIGWIFPLEFLAKKFQLPIANPDEPTLDNPFPEQKPVTPPIETQAPITRKGDEYKMNAALKTDLNQSDPFEQFADALASDWRPVIEPMVNPLIENIKKAKTYQEVEQALAVAAKQMDKSQLIAALSNSCFMAQLYGQAQ